MCHRRTHRAEIARLSTALIVIIALQANDYFSRTDHMKYAEILHIQMPDTKEKYIYIFAPGTIPMNSYPARTGGYVENDTFEKEGRRNIFLKKWWFFFFVPSLIFNTRTEILLLLLLADSN